MKATAKKSTRTRILDVSRQLIARDGYAAVSLRDIGQAVGIQQSGIYNHFNAKQDILVKLMIDHLNTVVQQARKSLDGKADVCDRLDAFTRYHVTSHIDFPEDVFLAFMELRSLEPGPKRDEIFTLRKLYEDILSEILVDGAAQGRFKVINVSVHSKAILSMLTGVTVWYRSSGTLSIEETADVYVKAVMKGVLETDPARYHREVQ